MSSPVLERVRELLARAGLADVPPRTALAAVGLGVVVVVVGAWRFWPAASPPEVPLEPDAMEAESASAEGPGATGVSVVVHVVGAVQAPGVYSLPEGSRAADAIAAAGGARPDAAVASLNLARVLADGEQIQVLTAAEAAAGGVPGGSGSVAASAGGVVNINRASAAELEELPGVGPATAEKIVQDREKNGPFSTPEDLMRVPGIGEKKFESLREYVSCG